MCENPFGRVTLESVTMAIKDGTHGTHARVDAGVPFLSAKNISSSGTVSWDEADDCISESEYEQIHRTFRLQPRDLLLTIVGSIGRRAVFDGSKMTFQRSVAYVRPDLQRMSERFLFHWFAHGEFQQELVRRSNSTAQAGLYLGELARTLVPDCTLVEQVKIAEILDTLDTTIRQTEAIIEKLKQVKLGLLHDLLTRGIDANGELRPPQSQAPHLYKDSPLGWIPSGWVIRALKDVASVVDPQPDHRTPPEDRDGAPYVGIGDFDALGELDIGGCRKVVRTALEKQERSFKISKGDIIFGKIGTIGMPKLLPEARIALTANVLLIQSKLRSNYVFHFLQSNAFERQLRDIINTTSQPALGIETMRLMSVAVPPPIESEQVTLALDALDSRSQFEARELTKLRMAKAGLMDDLLTGRVRVTPLLDANHP